MDNLLSSFNRSSSSSSRTSQLQRWFNFSYWLLALCLLSIWLSFLAFPFYVLVGVLAPCFPDLRRPAEMLLKVVQFPLVCSRNMVMRNRYDNLDDV